MNAALLHVHQQLAEVAVVAFVEVPHRALHGLPVDHLVRPVHLAQQRLQLLAHVPRGLSVERRVFDPLIARGGISLQILFIKNQREAYDDGRDVDDLAGSAVALDVGLAEDLLVRLFAQIQLLGETLQGVRPLSDARGLPQARHVHRVTGESVDFDALVMKLVAVEAVVVEHLLDCRILQILLKVLQRAIGLVQVIDPYARPRSEVVLWAAVDGSADYLSVP